MMEKESEIGQNESENDESTSLGLEKEEEFNLIESIKEESDGKEGFVRMSKAEKKLLKAQRMKEKRKAQLQEYKKRKKAKVKESTNEDDILVASGPSKDEQIERLKAAIRNGLNICVDLSYEDIHVDRELSSLSRQLSIAYGFLKRFPNPIHLHLCGLVVESVLYSKMQQQGFESWIIDRHTQLPWEIFPINRLVMLSPDATEVLETVESDKVRIYLLPEITINFKGVCRCILSVVLSIDQ